MIVVSKENCNGCPVFDGNEFQENMVKNDICHKREMMGCPKDEVAE